MTAKPKGRTSAESLLIGLRAQGFALRVSDDGNLLCSPISKLTPVQMQALKQAREEVLAILAWEATEPVPDDNTLRAWFQQLENPAPRRTDL